MAETALKIDHLVKRYGVGWRTSNGTEAVRDVSWRIESGQSWALAGPNGAGKSSLLRCAVGLAQPTSGFCAIFDQSDGVARYARMGYLPELFSSYPKLTVRECLRYYGQLSGLSDAELRRRVAEVLHHMELEPFANKRVDQLSKGLNQRLGLGQSLLHEPDLLVWDEPTTGLDPLGRRLVADIGAQHKAAGKTLLVATHIMADIERICDHLAIMVSGRLAVCGPVAALLQQHCVATVEDLFLAVMSEGQHAQ